MMKKNNIQITILLLLSIISTITYAQDKDSNTINYNLINSIPQNAEVYFNSTHMGNTPYRFMFSPSDSAKGIDVILKMKGYTEYSIRVTKEDIPINKTIGLIPAGNKSLLRDNNLVIENKSSMFNTPRKVLPLVLSSIFAGGGAILGYVFKTKANDLNDEYINTGDRSKLDDTKKYDLYSGLCFVAFQAGFSALIYFLLIK